jgi:hypothetical protein
VFNGRAGEGLANQDPEKFIQTVLGQAGLLGGTGSAFDRFAQEELVGRLGREYDAAQSLNQRLSAPDWLRSAYGAGYEGKKGNQFNAGGLNALSEPLRSQFETNRANTNPLSYITQNAMGKGLLSADASPEYQEWFSQQFAPRIAMEYERAQLADPTLNLNQFLATQDYGSRAQQEFSRFSSSKDPLGTLFGVARGSGILPEGANSEYIEWFNRSFGPQVAMEFQNAQRANPNINMVDWLAERGVGGRAEREFEGFRANSDPEAYALERAAQRGMTPSNGNAQFEDWYARSYAPQLRRDFGIARSANPNLNFNEWEAAQDPRRAQAQFANRAPMYREPSQYTPVGGRWSWWS